MKKQILIGILFFALGHLGFSQIGINVSYIKPSGDLFIIYKPSVGLDFRYIYVNKENRFRVGVSAGVFVLKPRFESYDSYIVEHSQTKILYPSKIEYGNFFSVPLSMFMNYKILDSKISPVVGSDIFVHSNSINSVGSAAIGLQHNIGVVYEMTNNYELSLNLAKNIIYKDQELGTFPYSYWKIYFTFDYFFD